MIKEEIKESIKKHYGDSDEDLQELGLIMDALADIDKVDEIKIALETAKLENEKALKDLDKSWRERYRERFFDGDVVNPTLADDGIDEGEEDPEDITIEDYVEELKKEMK